jgi:hypothetical protein
MAARAAENRARAVAAFESIGLYYDRPAAQDGSPAPRAATNPHEVRLWGACHVRPGVGRTSVDRSSSAAIWVEMHKI